MTTYKNMASSKSESTQAQKALALVIEFPFRTSRELANKANPLIIDGESLHKRLPELLKKGKLVNGNTRRCTVTHKLAKTWAIASAPTQAAAGGVGAYIDG